MHLKPLTLAILAAGLLAPAAWGQKKLIEQLQRDMALLHQDLREVKETTAEKLAGTEELLRQSEARQDRIFAELEAVRSEINSLSRGVTEPMRLTTATVTSLGNQYGSLRATVEDIGEALETVRGDLRDLKTQLTTLPPPVGEDGEILSEGDAMEASDATFEGGLSDYLRGNIDLARNQFLDYLALYSNHSKADQAQYYLAETYYSEADYDEAVRQFEQVYERHPLSPLAPDSLYKKGMSFVKLRDRENAARAFQSVLDRFPDSKAAPNARSELNSLQNSKPAPGR